VDAFHFLYPLWLLALPPLWGFGVWRAWRTRGVGAWSRVIDPQLLAALRLPGGHGRSPWWLVIAVWTLAVLALSGMTWEREQSPAYHAPDDWILVLDLSPSMSATDVPPDRAARARFLISDILDAAQDTRVALVVFAGEAHTVAPLTTDVATVRALLPPLAPGIMPESGDALAPAIEEVSRLMRSAASPAAQVVILTDGIVDPAQALQAAQRLRNQGATVDVIGIGTEAGAPVPKAEGGFVQDDRGNTVLSQLPVDQLQRIAAAGGGRYVPASESERIISALKNQRARQLREDRENSSQQVQTWRNDGIWLLPPLLLCVPLLARRGWL
jgi:Ca-activated chloride channel family protein